MSDWVCYMIASLDSNKTYIGSSNNAVKRLDAHNSGKGAKYTRGQTWIHILIVSGFQNKKECLSFEAGWKKLSKNRKNEKFALLNQFSKNNLKYNLDTRHDRILDLLFFVHHFTLMRTHFKLNQYFKYPIKNPIGLEVIIFFEDWARALPWPEFIDLLE